MPERWGKGSQKWGKANLGAIDLLSLFNTYEMWSNNRVYKFCRGKIRAT